MKAMVDAAAANSSTDGAMLANQASFGVWAAVNQVPFATANAQLSSITSVESTLTAAQTAVSGSSGAAAGSTFTLTNNVIDNIVGTAGNDTIIGDSNTSAADQVNGGSGTDTLRLIGTTTLPTISSVENVVFEQYGENKSINMSTSTGVTSVTLKSQTTQGTGDSTLTLAGTQSLTLTTVQDSGNAGNELIIAGASSVTANTITLDKAGDSATGGNDLEIEIQGTGVKTLNLVTANNASRISLVDETTTGDFAVDTITITGNQNLTIAAIAASTASKITVNASALTGTLNVDLSATEVFEATGTAGNDRFAFGAALTTADKAIGNGGVDTVAATTAAAFTTGLTLTNINTLEVSTATTGGETLAMANVTGAKDVNLSDVAGGIANGQNFTVSGLVTGATVTIETDKDADAGTVTYTLATPTGTADVLNLVLNANDSATASATTSTVVTGYETLNITSNLKTGQTAGTGTHTFTAMTGVQMKNMTIAGAAPVVIVANAGMVNLTSIDASTATGAIILGNGTTAALIHAADTASFKTGSGSDAISFDIATDAILALDAGSQSATGSDTLNILGTAGTGTTKIDLSSTTDQITQINGGANTGVLQVGFENVISVLATNGLDITGSTGKNTITGSNAVVDLIRGGAGADTLDLGTTGTADTVIYDLSADVASGTQLVNADTIANFSNGAAGADKINIGGVTLKAGNGTTLATTLGTSSDGTFTTNAKDLDGATVDLTADGSLVVRDTASAAGTAAFGTQAAVDAYVNALVANAANITSAAGTKILIAVDGNTANTFALFMYDEGTTYEKGIQADEISLVGVFTGVTFATDVVAATFI